MLYEVTVLENEVHRSKIFKYKNMVKNGSDDIRYASHMYVFH